jgi:hypothetical protein
VVIAGSAVAVLIFSYAINGMDRVLFPLLLTDVRREYGFSLARGRPGRFLRQIGSRIKPSVLRHG